MRPGWQRGIVVAAHLGLAAGGCSETPELGGPTSQAPERRYAGGALGTVFTTAGDAFEQPLPALDRDGERTFFKGRALFRDSWLPPSGDADDTRDGLGPTFNAQSCHACHEHDGRGVLPAAGEPLGRLLVRVSVPGEASDGGPLPEPSYGGQIQPFGAPGAVGEGTVFIDFESVPGAYEDGDAYALARPSLRFDLSAGPLAPDALTSVRMTQHLVGLGLLEAIPEASLAAQAGDGLLQQVVDIATGEVVLGRFGWKATQPTVKQQTAGAFAGDMGLTTHLFPLEDCAATTAGCPDLPSGGEPEVDD
ncbi:MAG: thiol oxidoreductase, partial [Myxococcales bacterium]|nr:thiol oxidoreductase [Myxococcales bacterium]